MPQYIRRKISNKNALELEQRRVKRMRKEMERNLFTLGDSSSDSIVDKIVNSITHSKDKSSKNASLQSLFSLLITAKGNESIIKQLLKSKNVRSFILSGGKSWLRWQAFNASIWLIQKGIKQYRRKKQNNKTEN